MGAWIETAPAGSAPAGQGVSHPVWVRGLKLISKQRENIQIESHPVWVRGLKPKKIVRNKKEIVVAPRVGAWIETQPEIIWAV